MSSLSNTIKTISKGQVGTKSFRLFFKDDERGYISPFHDVPLCSAIHENRPTFNMVVEIPRWTNAKIEISKSESLNPMNQDMKKDKLRYVNNLFPYKGYMWNYGALPQTYEDPSHKYEGTCAFGDNDPLDVIEVGSRIHRMGAIVRVKVLGVLGLIDDGETDWKIVAIDVNDPMASKVSCLDDVELEMSGLLEHTSRWFRLYKVPTGNEPNCLAFDGEFKDVDFALKIIEDAHKSWEQLLSGKLSANSKSAEINFMSHYTNVPSSVRSGVVDQLSDSTTPAEETDKDDLTVDESQIIYYVSSD